MKKWSLASRIMLLVAALVLGLLGAVSAIIGLSLNSSIGSLVAEENLQISSARAAELGKLIDMHLRELHLLSVQDVFVRGGEEEAATFARRMSKEVSSDITNVLIAWPDGRASGPVSGWVDIHDRPYFTAILRDGKESVISDPVISKGTGKAAVILAIAVKGSDGKTRAMLGFEMQLSSLSAIIGNIKVGKSGYGWVVDGSGLVIAHPNEAAVMKLQTTDADKTGYRGLDALARRMVGSESGYGSYLKPDGSSLVTYWARVPSSPGWSLGLSVSSAEVGSTVRSLLVILVGALLAGLIVAVLLSLLLARSIVSPIQVVAESMALFSRGDLSLSSIDADSRERIVARGDELGDLGRSLRDFRQSLQSVVGGIRLSAAQVSEGSQQLSGTAQGLSQGSNEQAASIEELSASVEEQASTIKQNADNTSQADALARRVAQNAEESGKAVGQTVVSMKEIAGKIGIIEEIASQTNLLALNAAIEAARAGEAGKGFAVVASEVRKLAERSATAAGEINRLSKTSVGVAIEAGKRLEELVPDIRKTAELIQEISAASSEQSSGAEQIAKGVSQMDSVVQQNASASEELASTAEELAAQAERLREGIDFFKLDADES